TVLTFEDPVVISTERGSYPVFNGIPARFAAGEPIRPSLTLYIPVPDGAVPELSYSATSYRSTGITSDQARTPAIEGEGLSAREIDADPVSPEERHVVLSGIIPLAGTRVAMIRVFPVAGESGSSYASRIDVQLQWDPVPGGISVEGHSLLRLIAPEDCLFWRNTAGGDAESVFWGKPWARIAIENSGGYTLSGNDLVGGGCEIIGSPCASLRLFTGPGLMFSYAPEDSHELSEVAFTVNDQDNDGLFDEDDYLEFFGRGLSRWEVSDQEVFRLQHRYATHNVYWLTWGSEDGRRIDGISGQPDSSPGWGNSIFSDLWFREEHIWMPDYEGTTGWVWETISEGESITIPFQVTGSGRSSIAVSVVTNEFQSRTVEIYINGSQVLTDTWSGAGSRTLRADSLQLSGSCTLEIVLVEELGGGLLGLTSLQVTYPDQPGDLTGIPLFPSREKTGRYNFSASGVSSDCSVYNISDINTPELINDTEYTGGNLEFSYSADTSSAMILMDSGDWMSPDSIVSCSPGRLIGTVSGGDRLIIVHPSLQNGIFGIETLSSMQGHSPVVATTTEIYDEFGQGVADPCAIRSAVRWGIDDWSGGLMGVILAGDGHYDFLGHATTQPVMIPPWIKLLVNNYTCVDDMYTMVHENAIRPEVPIARIPVDNLSQLGSCTAKLLSYHDNQNSGTWMNRVLVIADDEWGNGAAQSEASHTQQCELIAEEVLPSWISREKFYLIEYPWPPGSWPPEGPHPEKPEARESFIETFNQGYLFTQYQGHGAADQIAHEVIMLDEDVSSLVNGHRLPVSFWGTCNVGEFDSPGSDAISETLVYHPAGGSISSVAATRGTQGPPNYYFFRSIIDSLFHNQELTVGDAVWQSKLTLDFYSNNKYYVLFGYPDMPLPLPDSDGSVIISDDTLWSGELNTISGNGFQNDGLAFIEILESSSNVIYTCLGGITQIPYIRYGGTAYSGSQLVEGGEFNIDCFIPVQSLTGSMARGAALALSSQFVVSGAEDPAVLALGTPQGGDLEGPSVTMWIRGYEGIGHPELTGDIILEAELTDSSGICLLGGFGKELNLFVDGNGNDISSYFSYNRGSSVTGKLAYTLEALEAGEHILILMSVDGLGNSSMDTLNIRILEESNLDITEALVYPNPGNGRRCFSFRISEDAQVTVSIYTVAGTRIEELTQICSQGYNQILWDGLDHDGDAVASGPYIYKINAEALGTSTFSRTTEEFGILAVIRED
ncbi:MAG: hypothetical protein KAR44_03985, partial [Candidatus Aegiribacteria sp.]|nr:hypothetical protein [Candidatus Aegiribacteria sp.]